MIKKTQVFKNGQETNCILSSNFNSIEEYEAFLQHLVDINHFGLPERPELNEMLEPTGNILPAEYEIIQTDITQQNQEQQLINKNLARIQFGQRLMAELAAKNQIKLSNQLMTIQQVFSLEDKLAKVQSRLVNGSTGLALSELISLDLPEMTTEEKAYFVSKIQDYLNSEA